VARRTSKSAGKTGGSSETGTDTTPDTTIEGAATDAENVENALTGDAGTEAPGREEPSPEDSTTPETMDAPEARDADDIAHSEDSPQGDAIDEPEDAELVADDPEQSETAEPDAEDTPEPENTAEPAPAAAAPPVETRTIVEKTGPGFGPLVIGGVVAAAIGYLASVSGFLPGAGGTDNTAEIEAALASQSEILAGLQEQISALATAPEPPGVDLSPVTEEISALGVRIDETAGAINAIGERVATLEERPIITGDVTADSAAVAEALAAMEAQMRAQVEEAERRAAEAVATGRTAEEAELAAEEAGRTADEASRAAEEAIAAAEAEAAAAQAEAEAAQAEAEAAMAEAEAAMAAAQAEAEAAMAAAEAEAALNELRLAIARGEPFADPLAAVAVVADVPEALSAAAETGVSSLEQIQDAFPAAARSALPVALRETAGDGAMDRLTAFVQGQIGGRAVVPREGDDPDAILSRVQAAVSSGDLETALAEISALPDGARAEMAGWIADAEARTAVMAALETVAGAVAGAN
jgi:hypothetical protein